MTLPAGIFNESYGQDMAIVRTKTQWVLLALFVAALLYFPRVGSEYLVGFVVAMSIWVVCALGLNITLGYCGQISIAPSAFMAVGGFTAALLEKNLGIAFWWTLPLAALSAGLVGLLFGIPSLRCKGFYLTLSTLAAQIVIVWIFVRWRTLVPDPFGIRVDAPQLGPFTFGEPRQMYYLVIPLTALMAYFTMCLVNSKVGRAFMAVRDNEVSAECLGIDVFRYKLIAFFIGCAYAGISGALYVHYIGVAQAEQFTLWVSIWIVGMVLIGGLGAAGTIFGVVFIRVLEELSGSLSTWVNPISPALAQSLGIGAPEITFGGMIVLFLIFSPNGIAHRWNRFKGQYRIWPYAYQEK